MYYDRPDPPRPYWLWLIVIWTILIPLLMWAGYHLARFLHLS